MQYCAHGTCSAIVKRGYCPKHDPHRDSVRPNREIRKLYRTARWLALAARVRREEPICRDLVNGETCGRETSDVDHMKPHGGDLALFWSRANLRARCHSCHSRKTLSENKL